MFRATANSSPGGLLKSYISYSGSSYSNTNITNNIQSTITQSTISKDGAIPESLRMRLETCTDQYIQTPLISACDHYDGSKTIVTIPKGSQPNHVLVRTRPASETIKQRKDAILYEATNPYNPDTRFAKYQEPLPPQPQFLVVCPDRPPNPGLVFKPGTVCVINRFQGSKPPDEE